MPFSKYDKLSLSLKKDFNIKSQPKNLILCFNQYIIKIGCYDKGLMSPVISQAQRVEIH